MLPSYQIHGLEIISPILWLAFSFYCFFFSLSLFLGGLGPRGKWKFLGRGLNLCCCSNNAGSLSCCATRQLLLIVS